LLIFGLGEDSNAFIKLCKVLPFMLNGEMFHYFPLFELHVAVGTFDDRFFAQVQVPLQLAHRGLEPAVEALGGQRADHAACEMRLVEVGELATQRAHFERARALFAEQIVTLGALHCALAVLEADGAAQVVFQIVHFEKNLKPFA
jgi:hypothetical protein